MATAKSASRQPSKDAPIRKESQSILDTLLKDTPSVVFVSVSTVDGNSFAHASSRKEIDSQRLAAITSSLLALSETLSHETLKGKCSYNAISTDFGSIITVRVPSKRNIFTLSLCADKSENMAMAMRTAFDTADKLSGVLS